MELNVTRTWSICGKCDEVVCEHSWAKQKELAAEVERLREHLALAHIPAPGTFDPDGGELHGIGVHEAVDRYHVCAGLLREVLHEVRSRLPESLVARIEEVTR